MRETPAALQSSVTLMEESAFSCVSFTRAFVMQARVSARARLTARTSCPITNNLPLLIGAARKGCFDKRAVVHHGLEIAVSACEVERIEAITCQNTTRHVATQATLADHIDWFRRVQLIKDDRARQFEPGMFMNPGIRPNAISAGVRTSSSQLPAQRSPFSLPVLPADLSTIASRCLLRCSRS